jgi:hypothetical protein
MALEHPMPFPSLVEEGAEVHIYINMGHINIERRNNEKSKHLYTQLNPTFRFSNTPQPWLEITVHSFLRPSAFEIAFEILACVNSHIQMGHGHLASLLSSQSVSRGHQVNLVW